MRLEENVYNRHDGRHTKGPRVANLGDTSEKHAKQDLFVV